VKKSDQTIFLLGAGASKDAGMPLVADVTEKLACCLPDLLDSDGNKRPEFKQLFDAIAKYDPEVTKNYERFVDWLHVLIKTQNAPFKKAFCARFSSDLIDAARYLELEGLRQPICDMLNARRKSPRYDPHYLSQLRKFIPNGEPLQVFSLNYDLTVEDACKKAKISFTTGFKKEWCPSLFRNSDHDVNLYKLHGSLSWFSKEEIQPARLIEKCPDDRNQLPELVLGPGKLQDDEPFVTLYSEFHNALRQAKACVVIGCSFADDHIKTPLQAASNRGMTVVDVRPGSDRENPRYKRICSTAKDAFESNAIVTVLDNI
jgi:SIR2-like protein